MEAFILKCFKGCHTEDRKDLLSTTLEASMRSMELHSYQRIDFFNHWTHSIRGGWFVPQAEAAEDILTGLRSCIKNMIEEESLLSVYDL